MHVECSCQDIEHAILVHSSHTSVRTQEILALARLEMARILRYAELARECECTVWYSRSWEEEQITRYGSSALYATSGIIREFLLSYHRVAPAGR
jgi:hypothetical protein